MARGGSPTACLIVIGNEVLSGRTRDANLQALAHRLTGQGITLGEARVIPDDRAAIVATVNACRVAFDLVFTSGGIGPTHDDITAIAVAEAFGVPTRRDRRAVARLNARHKPKDLNPARLKMAEIPEGADLIDNPVSGAPGFSIGNVYVLAGVPRIFDAMLDGLLPRLPGGAPILSRTVAAYLPEGDLAGPLGAVQADFPDVPIGSYPFARDGRLGAALIARTPDPGRLRAAVSALCAMIEALGGAPLLDTDPRTRFE